MPVTEPRCTLCRYWSQRHVRQLDFRHGGRIEAACLLRTSPNAGRFMGERGGCTGFAAGVYAADAPGGERRAA